MKTIDELIDIIQPKLEKYSYSYGPCDIREALEQYDEMTTELQETGDVKVEDVERIYNYLEEK